MTRLSEHSFVTRDMQPIDLPACHHCGWPGYFCLCDPEEELPAYRGSDPASYPKEKN